MRFLIAIAALACVALTVRADEPVKYYLVDGKVTEKRVADLEARVAQLEKQIAEKVSTAAPKSGDCPCGPACPCATAAKAPSVAPPAEYVQVCENGRCSLRAVPASATAPQTVDYGSPMGAVFGSCAGGSCSSSVGWYPGKWLGRR